MGYSRRRRMEAKRQAKADADPISTTETPATSQEADVSTDGKAGLCI
jgi:hypothetical protein